MQRAPGLSVLILASAPLAGQHVAWQRTGPPLFGPGTALVNDLDADGQPDLAIHVRPLPGSIRFLSSRDGSVLPPVISPPAGDVYYRLAGLGDVDGDGFRDFLVEGIWLGQIGLHAISGRTHQRLWFVFNYYGNSMATELDVNGDGRPDLVVARTSEDEPAGGGGFGTTGVVYAYDHQGQLLHRTYSREPWVFWTPGLVRFGDRDGDGCDDYLVQLNLPGGLAGGVDVVSGRTGLGIGRVVVQDGGSYWEASLATCGDLDQDGVRDIAISGSGASGRLLHVFSTATGQLLRTWSWSSTSGRGMGLFGTVDLDQDGVADVIAADYGEPVTPTSSFLGTIRAFGGRDGSILMRFVDTAGANAGTWMEPVEIPPAAGSVFPRFVGGSASSNLSQNRVYLFTGGPEGVATVGTSCAGTLTAPPRIGLRSLDATHCRITLSGAEPGMLSLLVLGASRPAVPQFDLRALGFTGCTLHPAVDQIGVFIPGLQGLDRGCAVNDLNRGTVPGPVPPGFAVFGQWVVLGSGSHWPGGATAALRWFLR